MNQRTGFLDLLRDIDMHYGLVVLMLVLIIAFVCLLFWKLVWKVWSETSTAKDQEIARLAKERDRYQNLVFGKLQSSDVSHIDRDEVIRILRGTKRN